MEDNGQTALLLHIVVDEPGQTLHHLPRCVVGSVDVKLHVERTLVPFVLFERGRVAAARADDGHAGQRVEHLHEGTHAHIEMFGHTYYL